MTKVRHVSLTGKMIALSLILTMLLSLDLSWRGGELPFKGYILFSTQVGFVLIGVLLTRRVPARVVTTPMSLLWCSLLLLAIVSAISKPYAWDIVKQAVLISAACVTGFCDSERPNASRNLLFFGENPCCLYGRCDPAWSSDPLVWGAWDCRRR